MPDTYAPRYMTRLADIRAGDLTLKVYWIDAHGAHAPPPALLEAAAAATRATLREAASAEGEAQGQGFAVLHRGDQGTWLLMDWWAHGDILCQRLARADPGTTGFVAMDHRPLMACVWEMQVIEAERRAWIDHMMTGTPEPSRWRDAGLPDGPR